MSGDAESLRVLVVDDEHVIIDSPVLSIIIANAESMMVMTGLYLESEPLSIVDLPVSLIATIISSRNECILA